MYPLSVVSGEFDVDNRSLSASVACCVANVLVAAVAAVVAVVCDDCRADATLALQLSSGKVQGKSCCVGCSLGGTEAVSIESSRHAAASALAGAVVARSGSGEAQPKLKSEPSNDASN